MKKVILFEGIDGSGKSTMINMLCDYLELNNFNYKLVNKDNLELTKNITNIYKYTDTDYKVEIFLRIAREFAKAKEIDNELDFILIDRAILSLATTINTFGDNWNDYNNIIQWLKNIYGDFTTVFCKIPFSIARERVIERNKLNNTKLSKKEAKGYEYNEMIYNILMDLKSNFDLVGENIIELDTYNFSKQESFNILIEKLNI